MSSSLMAWVLRESPYGGADLFVHLMLADSGMSVQECGKVPLGSMYFELRPARLAGKLRMPVEEVEAVMASLEQHGYLIVLKPPVGDETGHYLLNCPEREA